MHCGSCSLIRLPRCDAWSNLVQFFIIYEFYIYETTVKCTVKRPLIEHTSTEALSLQTIDLGIRNTYRIRVDCSPIYECALGIAAFTWPTVHDKLETSASDILAMKARMSERLCKHVQLAGEVHTWRSLLVLAHRCDALYNPSTPRGIKAQVDVFVDWIRSRQSDLIHLAAPYLGTEEAQGLRHALGGDKPCQAQLLASHTDNEVVRSNLAYLFDISPTDLLEHLEALLTHWAEEMVTDWRPAVEGLQRDRDDKRRLAHELAPEQLIRWATKGNDLQPEPGVDTLWLIPQIAYRPFTIRNHLAGCAVFYYPVADENLPGGSDTAVVAQIAQRHKAVGDVNRVRLLALLRIGPKPLAELANAIQSSKSTTHHHLTLLRSAGFVTVSSGVYSIDAEQVAGIGDSLADFLQLRPDTESGRQ